MRILLLTAALVGCASTGAGPAASSTAAAPATQQLSTWPVRTADHIDLWLHSLAMVSQDTTAVPLFRRGYRDSVTVLRNRANVMTSLDANRSVLQQGMNANPAYLQAHFIPFEYNTWDQLRATIERFLQLQGDVNRAPDQATAQRFAQLASVFRTAADREWLRLFLTGVTDEAARYFTTFRADAIRDRASAIAAVDSLWLFQYRTKFERFLRNIGQRNGEILLSLPLGGEGRTTTAMNGNARVAVTLPARPQDAPQSLYVFAHEVTGSLVGSVVSDNTSPAEKRDGVADRLIAVGQVRAGAMLLERVAPELVAGYVRYYLEQAGKGSADTRVALERAFPLPAPIAEALSRQVEIVLGGI